MPSQNHRSTTPSCEHQGSKFCWDKAVQRYGPCLTGPHNFVSNKGLVVLQCSIYTRDKLYPSYFRYTGLLTRPSHPWQPPRYRKSQYSPKMFYWSRVCCHLWLSSLSTSLCWWRSLSWHHSDTSDIQTRTGQRRELCHLNSSPQGQHHSGRGGGSCSQLDSPWWWCFRHCHEPKQSGKAYILWIVINFKILGYFTYKSNSFHV